MDSASRLIIESGFAFLSSSFALIVAEANRRRLEEKKVRKQKDSKKSTDPSDIRLSKNEELDGRIDLDIDKTISVVNEHLKEIERWSQVIKFGDLEKKKKLGSVYIQLDTYLLPARRHIDKSEKERTIALESAVLSNNEHCIILGQPGAGKSTSLKKVCDILLKEQNESDHTIPVLLRLRDLGEFQSNSPLMDHICSIFPFMFQFNGKADTTFEHGPTYVREEAVFSFLNHTKIVLVLDGFDELKDAQAKSVVVKELVKFANKLTESKLVLSCRTGEFNYELSYSNTFEIAPLNEAQIELFVNKWLNNKEKSLDFLDKVRKSPFADTSIKPLSLAHLCAIYERIGNVPDQPKTIYRKVVNLLIEEWDEQRAIIRKSAFGGFQSDQKFEFLTHLAFYLTTTFQSSTFSIDQFKSAYNDICDDHDLPKEKSSDVVKELESHTGLFIESGYQKYDFVHKSIQEYLTAEYLVKLPTLNTVRGHFESLGAELAIAVSISSNSSLYYIELILNYFIRLSLSNSFYSSFASRIQSENPSFNQNKLVSVATLALLSKWINEDMKAFSPNEFDVFDRELYSSFHGLARSLKLKEQRAKISEYYRYKSDAYDGDFVELIRIKVPKDHKRLPSKVYLPIDLYLEFNYD